MKAPTTQSVPRVLHGLCAPAFLLATSLALVAPLEAAPQLGPTEATSGPLRPRYVPDWDSAPALRELSLAFDGALTGTENGERLKDLIEVLLPGDRLRVGPGRWSVNPYFQVDLQGTAAAPIRIIGDPGAVLTRPNAGQNVVNFGSTTASSTRFLLLRGFDIQGGSYGIRIQNVEHFWIDQCRVHGTANTGIGANSHDTDHLTITRTEVFDTNGTGEGMYLGGNGGSPICSHAVIALNHVHDTGGNQGDGIELKQGSFGSLIAENVIHGTNYPGLIVYGTGGETVNVIEGNVIWDTATNPFQVQGEAIVRNNLVFAENGPALQSGPHQDTTTNLKVIGNTFIARDSQAAFLRSWSGKPGMVLANNVIYSETGESVHVNGTLQGVAVHSNVVLGPVYGVSMDGFVQGNGLSDFVDVSWDGARRDARPTGMSALNLATVTSSDWNQDLNGAVRPAAPKVGALEPGTYGRYLGHWRPGSPRIRSRFPLQAGSSSYTLSVEGAAPLAIVLVTAAQVRDDGAPSGGAVSGGPAVLIRGVRADANGRADVTIDGARLPNAAGAKLVVRAAMWSGGSVVKARRMVVTARP